MRVLVGPRTDDLTALYAAPAAPWLRVNMISTLDGAATGETGTSGSINNEPDHLVFDTLRSVCDAVLVGAGTIRAEQYSPFEKPLVVVTRSGAVPPTLRHGEPGSVLLATHASAPHLAESRELLGADHVLVLGDGAVDLAALRFELAERGFRDVLGEGGPHLLGDLLAAGAVDELCATVTPRLIAGAHLRMVAGPALDVPLRLHTLLESDGTLLGRWLIGSSAGE